MKYLLLFISLFIISNNSFAQMSFLHIYDEDIKMSKLKKLAKKNNSDAQCELGVRYYSDKNNHKKALYWWKKAAEQDNEIAQFHLGQYYLYYSDDTIKSKIGFDLVVKSAEKGFELSQMLLARYYLSGYYFIPGIYVEKIVDLDKGLQYLNMAIEKGHNDAKFVLGNCYANIDEIKDMNKAFYWWKEAAKYGHDKSIQKLNEFNQEIPEREYEKALHKFHGSPIPHEFFKTNIQSIR
ncbi:MAG: tetratricopeptide repeat protein [Bacteroidales bacterium]|nr:tetratricopeptide repeat protein [Bacteroidales bacterium]